MTLRGFWSLPWLHFVNISHTINIRAGSVIPQTQNRRSAACSTDSLGIRVPDARLQLGNLGQQCGIQAGVPGVQH